MTLNKKRETEIQSPEKVCEEHETYAANNSVKKRTLLKNIKHGIRNITVEPVLMLFILASILNSMTSQNLSLDKACRVKLQYPAEICDSLRSQDTDSKNEYEKEIQKIITKYISYKTYLTSTVPVVISILAGSFSDTTGRRKLFLIIPICSQILVTVNDMFNTYFFYELSLEYLYISDAILEALSGGWSLPSFTAFAYISAITTEKNRTFRMGLLNLTLTVGFPIGMSLSGVLLKMFGFYGGYLTAFTCHSVNLLYVIFILREAAKSSAQSQYDKEGFCHLVKTFFNFNNIREVFRVLCKGPNRRRWRIFTYMAIISVLHGPAHGEVSVLYLFTRYKFSWNELEFSFYQTYNFIIHTAGTIFSIIVFSKCLGWHDAVLGIISTISKITAAFMYAFAPTGQIFLIGPIVDILNGTASLAIRSIITKFVEHEELGKINSIISSTENLIPVIYVSMYTNVYKATMETFPGAFFLVGAASTVPAVCVFVWLFVEHLRKRSINLEKDPVNL